jgi:tetratricopeptide (TPR) repeat protein
MNISLHKNFIFYLFKRTLFIIFIFSSLIANAQQSKIDSLRNIITATKEDTVRMILYENLGQEYRDEKKMDSSVWSYDQAVELNKKNKSSLKKLSEDIGTIDYILFEMGNYTQSLQYALQRKEILEELKDDYHSGFVYLVFGHDYRGLGEYDRSLKNYFKARQILSKDTLNYAYTNLCIALTYLKMGKNDSALFHTNEGYKLSLVIKDGGLILLGTRIYGDIYLSKGDEEMALKYYRQYIPDYVKYKERNRDLGFVLNSMASIFLKRNQNDSAAFYAYKALENGEKFHDQQNIYDAANILYQLADNQNNELQAFTYFKMAAVAKDSMASSEKIKQAQILAFNEQVREKEQQKADAKKAAKDRMVLIISSILFAIVSSLIWFRIRQLRLKYKTILEQKEAEKLKVKYEKQMLELEAKALRAQMNPHFIFNCMNSIKALVQQKQEDKAVNYLTTFSKLIRTIFQNSDKREITLFDEMETCKLYTQLESMRFGKKFSYHFNIDETIDLKSVQVPALIIQPFIENAIWHGIMPKEEGGSLSVSISRSEEKVACIIDDDGIGREMSKQNKFKVEQSTHQSKGVHLTQSRLDLNNSLNQRNASLEIIDKKDADGKSSGTKIILTFIEF